MASPTSIFDQLSLLDDGRKELKVYVGIKQLFNSREGGKCWVHSEELFFTALLDLNRQCKFLAYFVGTERFLVTSKTCTDPTRKIGQLGKEIIQDYFNARRGGELHFEKDRDHCQGVFFRTLLETQSHCTLTNHLQTLDDGRKAVKVFVGIKELYNNKACTGCWIHGEEFFVQTLLELKKDFTHPSFLVGIERFLVATRDRQNSSREVGQPGVAAITSHSAASIDA
jgi:hypothetical protein